jgi:hypothetical protein
MNSDDDDEPGPAQPVPPLRAGQGLRPPAPACWRGIILSVAGCVSLVVGASGPLDALKIGIGPQDVDRALTLARSREAERERFHAPYIQVVNLPFIERVEVVSEFRRVVLLAEEQSGN